MLLKLTWLEIQKIAIRPRSYIGFVAITLVIFLIQLAMWIDGTSYIGFVTQNIEQTFLFEGKILNGNLICFIILQTLIIQIPLLIALVTGDLISGEAATGTIRLLLTRPVNRTTILLSKYIAGSVYTLLMLVWLGILALFVSLLVFGPGDLIVLKTDEVIILQSADVMWRFLTALALAFLALSLVGALSLMLSCFTENSIGPIIITMAIIILFTIVGTMEVPLFDRVKPFLFTTHMIVWRNLFEDPLPMEQIRMSVYALVGHIVVFLGISIVYFKKKDILS
ncbi:MAG TPA: ABC transporter permease subunit [Bacteroidia bacterium]|nr:ABC transporter permease subunit [Bacteroidia bacterium]